MGKIYEIKKGNHYCLHLPSFHYGKTNAKAVFSFGDGCWFPLEKPDDFAINKLFGWSFGLHHSNSARIGWHPCHEKGKIDLFFYVYSDGRRFEQLFTTVEIGLKYTIEMDISNDILSFKLNGRSIKTIMDSVPYKLPKVKWSYGLFPYLGGKLPARTNTQIYLDILN